MRNLNKKRRLNKIQSENMYSLPIGLNEIQTSFANFIDTIFTGSTLSGHNRLLKSRENHHYLLYRLLGDFGRRMILMKAFE